MVMQWYKLIGESVLHQPIDVYFEWIDACDSVAMEQQANAADAPVAPSSTRQRPAPTSARAGLAPGEKFTDEDRNFIDDDDEDAEAEFADD